MCTQRYLTSAFRQHITSIKYILMDKIRQNLTNKKLYDHSIYQYPGWFRREWLTFLTYNKVRHKFNYTCTPQMLRKSISMMSYALCKPTLIIISKYLCLIEQAFLVCVGKVPSHEWILEGLPLAPPTELEITKCRTQELKIIDKEFQKWLCEQSTLNHEK